MRRRDRIDIPEARVRESNGPAEEYTFYDADGEMDRIELGWVCEEQPGPLPPSMESPAGRDGTAPWSDISGEHMGACVVRKGKRVELIPVSFQHVADRNH